MILVRHLVIYVLLPLVICRLFLYIAYNSPALPLFTCCCFPNPLNQVQYNIQGWLDKNKDPIQDCVVQLMQESKEPLVSSFFKDPEDGQ